jgi:ribosomal protein S16
MSTLNSIRAVIDLWPTRKDLAVDLCLNTDRIHKWAQVGAIPAKYHLALINAGAARGFPISADLLAQLHAVADSAEAAA